MPQCGIQHTWNPTNRSRPSGADAAAAVGFVVAASILDGQPALHTLAAALPVHYWQDWTGLFTPGASTNLGTGPIVQTAWIAVCTGVCLLILHRRDPAA
jgi:ABC-2 type transport system permease protein